MKPDKLIDNAEESLAFAEQSLDVARDEDPPWRKLRHLATAFYELSDAHEYLGEYERVAKEADDTPPETG